MKAPHAISFRQRHKDSTSAYGDIKRVHPLDSIFWIEDMLDAISPLPTTYDVLPVQPSYFSEFGYTDMWGGLYVYPMSVELSAHVMERAIKPLLDTDLSDVRRPVFEDKYCLATALDRHKKIIFLPGSNLLHIIDFDAVERLLYSDESIMVKPHPIMTMEGLRVLALKVGLNRIIDPRSSGMMLLENCERVWGTANSEIGLRAALYGIPYSDVTNTRYYPNMSYAAIHRLFTDDAKHNEQVIRAAISAPDSGLIMPWYTEEEVAERMKKFFALSMDLREQYRPMYPQHIPIQFGPQQSRGE